MGAREAENVSRSGGARKPKMVAVEIVSVMADAASPTLKLKAVVRAQDTVGAIIDGMPMVAATGTTGISATPRTP